MKNNGESTGANNEGNGESCLQGEAMLKERAGLFKVLEKMPLLVTLIDCNYILRYCNRYFQEKFGQWQGKTCYEVFIGRTAPCDACRFLNATNPGKSTKGEWIYKGSVFKVYNYSYYETSGLMMALVLGIDVTERRRLESKLRESEERYRKLVEMSPDAIALYNEKVEYINKAGLKLIGAIKPEEIVGKPVIDFMRPDCHEEVKQRINEVRNGVPAPLAEEKMIRLDGSVIDVEIVGAPLTIKGKNSFQVVIRDLTERKKMEKELARLDMLNLVGQMAASIGHEIRNPMTAVRGFLQVLKEKEDLAGYGEYFDLMIEEMDRANCIISEYLSLARDKRIERKKCDISKIIDKLVPLIRADAYETDKSIEYIKGEIPDLLVDEKEIRQLVLNLARNGLEAMPQGGKLTIKICTEGDDVVLAVRDRGDGIKPENRAKIGTPFYTTKENGTGLGLAVCYSIANRHNAVIDVETGSTGTTFYIRFRTGISSYSPVAQAVKTTN